MIWRFKALIIFLGLVGMASSLSGQDVVTWSSLNFKRKINKEFSVFLKPIVRHNLSQSRYLNLSPDYALIHTIDRSWSVMVLGRTWLMPNAPNRQFLFVDVRHTFSKSKFGWGNSIRIHQALDIERVDPDFLRYHSIMSYQLSPRIKSIGGVQVFYRVNGVHKIQRMRYITGLSIKLSDKIGIHAQYWAENFVNTDSDRLIHIIASSLSYNL